MLFVLHGALLSFVSNTVTCDLWNLVSMPAPFLQLALLLCSRAKYSFLRAQIWEASDSLHNITGVNTIGVHNSIGLAIPPQACEDCCGKLFVLIQLNKARV